MRPHRLDSRKHGGQHTSGGDYPASVRARAEQALRELPLSEDDIATLAPQIAEVIGHLRGGRISTDSLFFDFRGKVTAIVQHFASDGLTLADYLRVTGKKPDLFAQSPATILANVEGVVQRFAAQGLTRRDYLQAALRQPQLLQLAPATVEANLAGVVKRFRRHGLTRQDYLRAALRQTTLFTMSPGTVIAHVEAVVDHFRKHGLTLADYVRAARKQPTLFYQSPATIQRNIEGVVGHFKAQGLTVRDYLRAAVRQPSLFTQAPATIRANVEAVVARFGPHGLTLPDYLRAALRQPSLLGLSADRVFGQAEAVTAHFRAQGLTLEAYLQAVLRQPSLLAQSPLTLISNIECVVAHFRQHGLTLHDYFRAAARRPQLFQQSPATIQRNIEEVVGHFGAQGLTLPDYLRAAVRQPSLFYQSPATIIRHIYLVIDMRTQGLVTFPEEQNPGDGSPLRPLFGFLVKCPQYFCLSDDNYALRTEYARVTGDRPRGTALLTRLRSRVEHDLAAAQSQDSPASSGRSMMRSAATAPNPRAGFSLIMVSILITVAALIFVSVLPGQEAGDYNLKGMNSINKLAKVEESMRSFMAANGRRPCPADGQYAENTANFGKEAATPGTCTGGTPAAPLGPDVGTGFIVGGTIPTRTLALDDSYAYDEFGRRFTYIVDKRVTQSVGGAVGASTTSYCTYQQNSIKYAGTNPGITIESSTGGTVLDHSMYAYISHGASGYGAWPANGTLVTTSPAMRINSGSTDVDMQTNAGVDHPGAGSTFTYSTTNFTNVFVKKDKVAPVAGDTGFDDLVYYRPDLKNTCCLGVSCWQVGFRADGTTNWDEAGNTLATGDVNGDGIPDLIIGDYLVNANGRAGYTYVVFGTRLGFPDPLPLSSLNGTNGFRLDGVTANDYSGLAIAVGDVNGDGIADLVIGAGGANGDAGYTYVVFGKSSGWAASTVLNIGTGNLIDGTKGVRFDGVTVNDLSGYAVAAGDVNGDGYADVVIGAVAANGGNFAGYTYVVFGKSSNFLLPSALTVTTSNGSKAITPSAYSGLMVGQTLTATGIPAGDTIHSCNAGNTTTIGTVCTSNIQLTSNATGASTTLTVASTPLVIGANTQIDGTKGVRFDGVTVGDWAGYALATGDINGDGYADIVISAYGAPGGNYDGYTYVVFGKSTTWGAAGNKVLNIGAGNLIDGTQGVRFNSAVGSGDGSGSSVATGDVNGDGYADVVIGAVGGNSSAGYTYLVFGKSATWGAAGNKVLNIGAGNLIDGTQGVRFDGVTGNDNSGNSVVTGDINGDGYADILIGAYRANSGKGYSYVVFGKSATWGAAGNKVLNTGAGNLIDGTQGFRLDGVTNNDYLGNKVAIGDVNGDGIKDIIIGALNAPLDSGKGSVYVYFGHKTSPTVLWPNPNLSVGGL